MITKKLFYSLSLVVLCIGSLFRFTGLNWDAGTLLHPDERFLTMVTYAIELPSSWLSYFSTDTSALNPHNKGFEFFVYGTFPLFLVKTISDLFQSPSLINYVFIGRFVSALLDTLIVFLVMGITHKLFKTKETTILAGFIYSVLVLPIQLSHFFAVETFLVFFLYLSFFFLVHFVDTYSPKKSLLSSLLIGLALGLSLSSKITALFFLPVLGIGWLFFLHLHKKMHITIITGLIMLSSTLITFRVFNPYLFSSLISLNPKVINNWKQLKSFDGPNTSFPPAIQWINTPKIVFPLENLILWGVGLPIGLIGLMAIIYFPIKNFKNPSILVWLWFIFLFLYQGIQFAKPMRYLYPVYPALAVMVGWLVGHLFVVSKRKVILLIPLLLVLLVYPVSFLSIYTQPHPRVAASTWIYLNIPPGSSISCEHWDDCLPLNLRGFPGNGVYKIVEFPLYHFDTPDKWQLINQSLTQVDYIILTSNRLYGSIMSVPDRYPQTNRFYQSLFSGELGFMPIVQFTSRPRLPLSGLNVCLTPPNVSYGQVAQQIQTCNTPGVSFVDDYADESFTVYDHPKVIIFKKVTEPTLSL